MAELFAFDKETMYFWWNIKKCRSIVGSGRSFCIGGVFCYSVRLGSVLGSFQNCQFVSRLAQKYFNETRKISHSSSFSRLKLYANECAEASWACADVPWLKSIQVIESLYNIHNYLTSPHLTPLIWLQIVGVPGGALQVALHFLLSSACRKWGDVKICPFFDVINPSLFWSTSFSPSSYSSL